MVIEWKEQNTVTEGCLFESCWWSWIAACEALLEVEKFDLKAGQKGEEGVSL